MWYQQEWHEANHVWMFLNGIQTDIDINNPRLVSHQCASHGGRFQQSSGQGSCRQFENSLIYTDITTFLL